MFQKIAKYIFDKRCQRVIRDVQSGRSRIVLSETHPNLSYMLEALDGMFGKKMAKHFFALYVKDVVTAVIKAKETEIVDFPRYDIVDGKFILTGVYSREVLKY